MIVMSTKTIISKLTLWDNKPTFGITNENINTQVINDW